MVLWIPLKLPAFQLDFYLIFMKHSDEREALILEIRAAFKEVSRGSGVSLHEARAIDNYESDLEQEKARELDTDSSWEEVPDKDIEYFHDVFSFFDVEGFRYYLPAYMVWSIKYFDVSDSCSSDNVIYSLEFLPVPRGRDRLVFDLLDLAQCRAICRFLKFMEAHPSHADDEAARRALQGGWGRFCPENKSRD